jgi:magnesium-transporting ATPase (P-type)
MSSSDFGKPESDQNSSGLSVSTAEATTGPRVIHSSSGRLRVRLPRWAGKGERALERRVCQLPGVESARASALTGNVLLRFDARRTNPSTLLDSLQSISFDEPPQPRPAPPAHVVKPVARQPVFTGLFGSRRFLLPALRSRVKIEGHGRDRRARIAFRGLDRDPRLASRVVQLLRFKHGVRAHTRPLTSHLVIEYGHQRGLLDEILAELVHLELPELPGEDRPAHPLDAEPLWQGLTRAIGALLGLGIVTFNRLFAPSAAVAAGQGWLGFVSGALNLVQGMPPVRDPLRRMMGHHAADLTASGLSIVSLAFAGFPLGLIVTGVESLLLLGEVTARRAAWRRYEEGLEGSVATEPGAVIRLEAGAKVPRAAMVIEGTGTATSDIALPMHLSPGARAPAGATLAGGPFVLELQDGQSFEPEPRPGHPPLTLYNHYLRIGGLLSLGYAGIVALLTRSVVRVFEAFLLMNPRTAVIALETANLATAARALRAGLTVVGTRPERVLELPSVLYLDGPRLLSDGLEIAEVLPPNPVTLADDVLAVMTFVSAAAGAPWGNVFPRARNATVSGGAFNGLWASATVDNERYTLGPPEDPELIPDAFLEQHQGGYILELRYERDSTPLGLVALRPKLSAGVERLVETCRRLGVHLELYSHGAPLAARMLARRAGITVVTAGPILNSIRCRQTRGARVAFVSDRADAASAFAACDLGIGLASVRAGEFPARADVLAPDLRAVADLLEAMERRELAVRDGVGLSALTNIIGAVLGLTRGPMGIELASMGVYIAALAAMTDVWLRLRGGQRPESSLAHLSDPHPERWGRRSVEDVLRALDTTENGLTSTDAAARRQAPTEQSRSDALLSALRSQLRTPITGIMSCGTCLTLLLNQPLNTALLMLTTSINILAGIWQEREVGKAAEALKRMSAGTAHVLRDGQVVVVSVKDVAPGDVLLLEAGTRVAADARLLTAAGLEVDEAALTGESLPVPKGPEEVSDTGRIVLEGSDVVVGVGRAVVVAVGRHTRLGATAAALRVDRPEESPMGIRLGRILKIALPLAAAGGTLAGLAGLVYGGAPGAMLTLGVMTALSAIPEGLPLLAGVGQAGVANRLAKRSALVHRIAAIEALGRVDIACSDKTGTMTEGRLAVRILADLDQEAAVPGLLAPEFRELILTAALACPHPDAPNAATHPTDRAVIRAALHADLRYEVMTPRLAEVPFDSARAYYAALVPWRLCVKGAPERIVARCVQIRTRHGLRPLDQHGRGALLDRVTHLAERGLRMLLVAEGPLEADPEDPQGLTALGFVGISDPLRPSVPPAIERCQAAGIRVIMLTGDHPATAHTIAREAGLLGPGRDVVVRAAELAELPPEELDRRMGGVAVIARATPMDKLRIVESLRRRGHVVAMTGDGVNDAPSLRLADVGVAMGQGGTEVARQAADVVLADDDFATLVESLVEGRGFWRNMRNALGLLLGGNAGELGLVVGGNLMGFGSPLNPVQIVLVNMITDALPCLAVVLQRPQHRDLAYLAREGLSALDTGLRHDVVRRGLATALPSLGAFLLARGMGTPAQASAVAFTSVVVTQLAQTLDAGRVQGMFSRSVLYAVGGSLALLAGFVNLPPVTSALGLAAPGLAGWGLTAGSGAAAVVISRIIAELDSRLLEGSQTVKNGEAAIAPTRSLGFLRA